MRQRGAEMAVILGFDIAATTGWALYDSGRPLAEITTGLLKCDSGTPEQKAAEMGKMAHLLLSGAAKAADKVVIEEPLRVIVGYGGGRINPAAMASLNALAGAVCAVAALHGKPVITAPVASWRKGFLGYARKKGMAAKDYKRACMERCRLLGISVARHDAADAVGVAFYGAVNVNPR